MKQVVQAQHSADGETTKLLLQLQDGLTVESVIMHYDTSGQSLHHLSLDFATVTDEYLDVVLNAVHSPCPVPSCQRSAVL
jgi:hypothetical protein